MSQKDFRQLIDCTWKLNASAALLDADFDLEGQKTAYRKALDGILNFKLADMQLSQFNEIKHAYF